MKRTLRLCSDWGMSDALTTLLPSPPRTGIGGEEVSFLMTCLSGVLARELEGLEREQVAGIRFLGDLEGAAPGRALQQLITCPHGPPPAANTGIHFNV